MNIEFLIATTNRTHLSFLEDMFQNVDIKNINALVINQCFDIPIPKKISTPHENIKVITVQNKGTSVSRNTALAYTNADIAIFTDDDVVYQENVMDIIHHAFSKYDADVITFQTKYFSDKYIKKYQEKPFEHTLKTALQVGDWEIAFRVNSIKGTFDLDERFGLGCQYPCGEYQIFLTDCIRNSLKLLYIPRTIVKHPDVVHSGLKFEPKFEVARGAAFARMLGIISIPASFYFALKKLTLYREKHSFYCELKFLFQGIFQILLKNEKH